MSGGATPAPADAGGCPASASRTQTYAGMLLHKGSAGGLPLSFSLFLSPSLPRSLAPSLATSLSEPFSLSASLPLCLSLPFSSLPPLPISIALSPSRHAQSPIQRTQTSTHTDCSAAEARPIGGAASHIHCLGAICLWVLRLLRHLRIFHTASAVIPRHVLANHCASWNGQAAVCQNLHSDFSRSISSTSVWDSNSPWSLRKSAPATQQKEPRASA